MHSRRTVLTLTGVAVLSIAGCSDVDSDGADADDDEAEEDDDPDSPGAAVADRPGDDDPGDVEVADPPVLQVEFTYEERRLRVTHQGGDALTGANTAELYLTVDGDRARTWQFDDREFAAGDTLTVEGVSPGSQVTLIHRPLDRETSRALERETLPAATPTS